ncbi:MAG: hypothetical protein ABI867_06725 [Kofleriaceae bacterium]
MRVVIAFAVVAIIAGCGKKAEHTGPAAEITGLAAVPANAEVVIAADVAKLSASSIIERAVEQLLLRDGKLADAWKQVREGCKIDIKKQVKHVMLALGPNAPGARPGTGPALMIATGTLPETDLSDCIGKLVGKGGGSVTGRDVAGRTVYQVKDGARTMFYAYGRPDTVVLGTTEAYVIEAIGAGAKLPGNPEFAAWLKLVDQASPVWAVGRVDDRVRAGLVKVLPGLKAGPSAIFGTIDPREGAKLELGAVMASDEDAKQLESFTNDQKKLFVMVAQQRALGSLVNKVAIQQGANIVRFHAPLDMDDVNHLLSMLDGGAPAEQDSHPAPK